MESYLKPSTGGKTAIIDIGLSTPTGSLDGGPIPWELGLLIGRNTGNIVIEIVLEL